MDGSESTGLLQVQTMNLTQETNGAIPMACCTQRTRTLEGSTSRLQGRAVFATLRAFRSAKVKGDLMPYSRACSIFRSLGSRICLR